MPGLARDESIAYAIAPSMRPSLAARAGCFQKPASGDVDFRLVGISSRPGKARLDRGIEGNWGYRTALAEQGDVEMVTINDILEAHHDCVPFLLEIDIDGFESDLFSANTEWVTAFR
jgi:hypothetical protein